jgi:hypothetical protein
VWEYTYAENYTVCHVGCRDNAVATAVPLAMLLAAAERVGYSSDIAVQRPGYLVCLPAPRTAETGNKFTVAVSAVTETGWVLDGMIQKKEGDGVVAFMWNHVLDPHQIRLPYMNNPCVLDVSFCCLYDVQSNFITGVQLQGLWGYDKNDCRESAPWKTWAKDTAGDGAQIFMDAVTWETTWDLHRKDGNVSIYIPFETAVSGGISYCAWDNGLSLSCTMALGVIFLRDVWHPMSNTSRVLPHVQQRQVVFHYSSTSTAVVMSQQQHTCIEQVEISVYTPQQGSKHTVVMDVLFASKNSTIGFNRTSITNEAAVAVGPRGNLQLQTDVHITVEAFYRSERIARITFVIDIGIDETSRWSSPAFDIRFPIKTASCVEETHLGGSLASTMSETDGLRQVEESYPNVDAWVVYGLQGTMVPVSSAWNAVSEMSRQNTNSQKAMIALIVKTPNGADASSVESLFVSQVRGCNNDIVQEVALSSSSWDLMRSACSRHPRDCISTTGVTHGMNVARGWLLLDASPCSANVHTYPATHDFARRTTGMSSAQGEMLITHYMALLCEIRTQRRASVHLISARQVRWPLKASSPDCIVIGGTALDHVA